MTEGLKLGSRKTHPEALTTFSSHSWLQAGPSQASGLPALAAGVISVTSSEISTIPMSIAMCSLREVLILTQLAKWRPLPVLRTSAAFLDCYLTPISARGIQEHNRLLGKMMFCKSKRMRLRLMVTLAAMCSMKPLTFLMASGIQELGMSSGSQDNQPIDRQFGADNPNLPRL